MHDLDERWITLIYGLGQTEVRPFPVIMLFIIHRSRVRIPGTTLWFACSGVLILSFFASLSLYFHIQYVFLLLLFLLCLPRTSVACSFQGMITFQSHMRIQAEDEICSAVMEDIGKVFGLAELVPVETNFESKWNCFIKKSFYELLLECVTEVLADLLEGA